MPKKRKLSREEKHARRTEVSRKAFRGELRFPGAIREIRDSLGLTQVEFAERFGLTRLQVIALEKGKANPTVETLDKIGKLFGFEVGFVPHEGYNRPPLSVLEPEAGLFKEEIDAFTNALLEASRQAIAEGRGVVADDADDAYFAALKEFKERALKRIS